MDKSQIQPFLDRCAILSKFKFFINDDALTVFTCFSGKQDGKFISIVKLDQYNRTLWTVHSKTTNDALMTHIALVRMTASNLFLNWSDILLQQYLPADIMRRLNAEGLYPQDDTFISEFSKKLFREAGLNVFISDSGFETRDIRNYALFSILSLLTAIIFYSFFSV